MGYGVQAIPVVGQQAEDCWSQVLVLPTGEIGERTSLASQKTLGYMAFTVKGVHADGVGREIVTVLLEQQERWLSGEVADLTYLKEIFTRYPSLCSLIAVIIKDGELLGWGYGGAGLILKRRNRLGGVLTAPLKEAALKRGCVEAGDRLLMGTNGLIAEMSAQLVEEVMSYDSIMLGGEELVTRVQAAEDNAGAAGYMLEIQPVTEEREVETAIQAEGEIHNGEENEVEDELQEQVRETGNIMEELPAKEEEKPQVFLRKSASKRKRILMLFVMVLVILVASVALGWKQKERMLWESKYDGVMQTVQPMLTEARALRSSNRVRSQQLAQEAETALTAALPSFATQKRYEERLQQTAEEVRRLVSEVSGEKDIGVVPIWANLTVLKEHFFGQNIAVDGGDLVVLDVQHGLLASIDGSTGEMQLLGGGQMLSGATLMTATKGRSVVMTKAGLIDWSISKKTSAILKEAEAEWKEVVGMGLFAGNVYLLDRGAQTIWQYRGLESGVGSRINWLKTGTQTSFSDAVDLSIDGDVWIGLSNGAIERYRRGEKVAFTISGLAEPVHVLKAIYTSEVLDEIYVLDQGNSRVVVFTKDGVFVRQYVWQGLAGTSDIAILPNERVLVAVSGASVYRIPIE